MSTLACRLRATAPGSSNFSMHTTPQLLLAIGRPRSTSSLGSGASITSNSSGVVKLLDAYADPDFREIGPHHLRLLQARGARGGDPHDRSALSTAHEHPGLPEIRTIEAIQLAVLESWHNHRKDLVARRSLPDVGQGPPVQSEGRSTAYVAVGEEPASSVEEEEGRLRQGRCDEPLIALAGRTTPGPPPLIESCPDVEKRILDANDAVPGAVLHLPDGLPGVDPLPQRNGVKGVRTWARVVRVALQDRVFGDKVIGDVVGAR